MGAETSSLRPRERDFGASKLRKPSTEVEEDVIVEGQDWPRIPDGSYLAQYTHHETAKVFNVAKVFVHFKILEPGPLFGVRLYRAFRASDLVGKPGRGGRFRLKKRSELYLTLCWLYADRGLRPDRLSLRALSAVILSVTTRTVQRDYKQRRLPDALQYSVIDEIKDIEVGTIIL